VLAAYPELKIIAIRLRGREALRDINCAACLPSRAEFFVDRSYEITNIVDRVGSGGDSFAGVTIFPLGDFRDITSARFRGGCIVSEAFDPPRAIAVLTRADSVPAQGGGSGTCET